MIQRSLLGKSRSLCSRSQYIPIVSPIRSHIPIRIRSLQERISSRYYSSTDTSKDGPSPDGAATGDLQSEIEDTDPIKKDIEVKDKEIIELKVGPKLGKPGVIRPRNLIYLINIGQVSSLGSRLSQPSRTHEARCSIRSRLRHLPLRLGPS